VFCEKPTRLHHVDDEILRTGNDTESKGSPRRGLVVIVILRGVTSCEANRAGENGDTKVQIEKPQELDASWYHDVFAMADALVFEGRCWKFGDNVPTDAIAPTHTLVRGFDAIRDHVLESLNPEFPKKVQAGDIICAGRNFGCSSGRAVAPKALKAAGVGAVVAESFSRTFYRNGFEVGLPVVELAGIADVVADGDRIRVRVDDAVAENLTSGTSLRGEVPPSFLLAMLRAGGIINLVQSDDLDALTR